MTSEIAVGTARSAALPREFYERSALEVAPDLLGKVLRFCEFSLRITETEAYLETDEASHSFNGPTTRNRPMFGAAGHCYVYFVYGMHWCANVVTGSVGDGQAVLLRGATPLTGLEAMRANRPKARTNAELTNGPGKLTAALGIDGTDNGRDFCSDPEFFFVADGFRPSAIRRTRRIGIRRNVDVNWRFVLSGSNSADK